MAFVDRHRHAQKLTPSREETVIAVLRSWAGGKDYWKEIQTPAGGLRPEQLNATNDD
ncbi:hypothetical protein AB2N04_10460 [Nitratireductor sp. GISD-1A_MAKvit]|uniref:hypothetical protein n=1 Tax=Nitratireductor sp. GISD-1A_MAKvit TaxID=3234198 RepID=UPI003464F33B